MLKILENFVYVGLSVFFLCCAVYVHFGLADLHLRLLDATLIKHSQNSQKKLISKWIVAANGALKQKLDLSIDSASLEDETDHNVWSFDKLSLNNNSISESKHHNKISDSWKFNTLNALQLMVTAEQSFLSRNYDKSAEITGRLLKREAHAKELLKGSLPKFVSNEYNVYKTRQILSEATYKMLMHALESGISNYRQAFRGVLYFRLYNCYVELSDYRRSRRNFELALEELGWSIIQDWMGSNRAVLRALYPRPYWPFVENLGYFLSFDSNLLYSIMSVESGFDPTKVSSAGACGLMQVMPNTANSLSRELSKTQLKAYGLSLESPGKQESFNCEKLKNIQLNIHLAALFLRQLQGKYDRANLIFASYNAGETIVRKWLERSKRRNSSFIEEVKFKETYDYISKVLISWLKYRSVYDGQGYTAQNVRYVN